MEKNASYIDWTHKFRDGVSEIQWDAENVYIFVHITSFTDATPVSHSVRQHLIIVILEMKNILIIGKREQRT